MKEIKIESPGNWRDKAPAKHSHHQMKLPELGMGFILMKLLARGPRKSPEQPKATGCSPQTDKAVEDNTYKTH